MCCKKTCPSKSAFPPIGSQTKNKAYAITTVSSSSCPPAASEPTGQSQPHLIHTWCKDLRDIQLSQVLLKVLCPLLKKSPTRLPNLSPVSSRCVSLQSRNAASASPHVTASKPKLNFVGSEVSGVLVLRVVTYFSKVTQLTELEIKSAHFYPCVPHPDCQNLLCHAWNVSLPPPWTAHSISPSRCAGINLPSAFRGSGAPLWLCLLLMWLLLFWEHPSCLQLHSWMTWEVFPALTERYPGTYCGFWGWCHQLPINNPNRERGGVEGHRWH